MTERVEKYKQEPVSRGNWDTIYAREGKVQTHPIGAVEWLLQTLPQEPQLSASPRILDAGCGTGRHTFPFLYTFPQSTVYAFDNSQTAITMLNKDVSDIGLGERVTTVEADLDADLTAVPKDFDVVIATLVVHHGYLKDINNRLNKLKARVKPGKYFVYATASTEDPRMLTGKEVEPGTYINTAQADGAVPHHYSTPEEIEGMFEGFEVIYKKLATPAMVTGDKNAKAAHWEYVFKKTT